MHNLGPGLAAPALLRTYHSPGAEATIGLCLRGLIEPRGAPLAGARISEVALVIKPRKKFCILGN